MSDEKPRMLMDRYRLDELAGRGGMGSIYRALDVKLSRTVAVKEMIVGKNPDVIKRALQEGQALAAISHPNILKIYDVIEDGSAIYLITEWIEGQNLSQIERPVHCLKILAMMMQVYEGLHAVHEKNILHRDLKPSNIMLTKAGRIVLVDFGVAYSASASQGNTIAGTLRYTDPAILEGKNASAQTDLYGAAMVQLELLTNENLIPEMAPLPLYQFLTIDLPKKITTLLQGTFPPLRMGLEKSFVPTKRAARSLENTEAWDMYLSYQTFFKELTSEDPSTFLKHCLAVEEIPERYLDRLRLITKSKCAGSELSAKQRALWLGFFDKNFANYQETRSRFWTSKKKWAATAFGALAAGGIAMAIMSAKDPAPSAVVKIQVTPTVRPTVFATAAPIIANVTEPTRSATPSRTAVPRPKLPKKVAATPKSAVILDPTQAPKVNEVETFFVTNVWADVYIDGQSVGRLPRVKPFMLKPGKYELSLLNPYMKPLKQTIAVSDQSKTVQMKFELQHLEDQ
jgi:serine/threonine protein kinase